LNARHLDTSVSGLVVAWFSVFGFQFSVSSFSVFSFLFTISAFSS